MPKSHVGFRRNRTRGEQRRRISKDSRPIAPGCTDPVRGSNKLYWKPETFIFFAATMSTRLIPTVNCVQQRFPAGSHASYAHWKASWLTLRMGRNAQAAKGFDEQIALYPAFAETPAALYWRARLAEEDNDPAMAKRVLSKT